MKMKRQLILCLPNKNYPDDDKNPIKFRWSDVREDEEDIT